ncbi:MAG: shikimate dehydrogenase [Candidatus Bathyarchaeia archaeon]
MESNKQNVSGRTIVFALIGDPIDHSMSPTIQNAAFRSTGLKAIYVPFRVESSGLRFAIQGMKFLGVRGFNVTTPYKTAMLRYLDEVETKAAEIKSINTVKSVGGTLTGFNTDGAGALNALKEAGISPDGKSILLFGAGGAARAIAHTLAGHRCEINIVNRTISRAQRLASLLRVKFSIEANCVSLSSRSLRRQVESADVILNASSMGMAGNENLPVHKKWLRPDQCVFDIVYRPVRTVLLRNAVLARVRTINGLDMLVNQGACSFTIWTGKKAPISEMRRSIARFIGD